MMETRGTDVAAVYTSIREHSQRAIRQPVYFMSVNLEVSMVDAVPLSLTLQPRNGN